MSREFIKSLKGYSNTLGSFLTFMISSLLKVKMIDVSGLNIAQSNLSVKSFVLSNLAFSLASPLGLIIGIFVADQPSSLPQVTIKTAL